MHCPEAIGGRADSSHRSLTLVGALPFAADAHEVRPVRETEGGLGQTTAYGARRKEGLKGKSLIMAAGELGGEERLTVTWHPRSLQSSVL